MIMGFNWQTLAAIVAIVLGVAFVFLYDDIKRNRVLARWKLRGRLSDAEVPAELGDYSDRAKLAVELRSMLAEIAGMPTEDIGLDDAHVFPDIDSLDSLGMVEYVLAVEDRFGIKIADKDTEKLTTLRDFVDYVAGLIKDGETR